MFQSPDLYLAAALDALGIPADKVERDGRRCLFLWGDKGRIEPLARQYYARNLPVDAATLADALRRTKSLLYAG